MFSEKIMTTPFTGQKANAYYAQQNKYLYLNGAAEDNTLLATARAVIFPHIEEGEAYWINYVKVRDVSDMEGTINKGTLYLCSVRRDDIDSHVKAMERLCPSGNGWVFLQKVKTYFKSFPVYAYLHPESKTSVVFLPRLTAQMLHGILGALPAFVPWFFPDKPSEKEMELLKSLTEKDAGKYLDILKEMAEPYDFEGQFVRNSLTGFAARKYKRDLEAVRSDEETLLNQINNYKQEIENLLRRKREYDIRALGLQAAMESADGDDELMYYFINHPIVNLENVEGERITYTVNDYLTEWNEETAEDCIERKGSFFYIAGSTRIPYCQEVKEFYKRLFIDRTLKLRMSGIYCIIPGESVDTIRGWDEFDDTHLPNPHLYVHRCLGNYIPAIMTFLSRGEIIGAVEQSITSARSVNLTESATNYHLIEDMYNSPKRCIEWPDGTLLTAKQSIKKIQDELKQEEQEAEHE